MADKIEGYLEVGTNETFEVVVNLDRERRGIGHIVFSPKQARHLARLLHDMADRAEFERFEKTGA